MKKLIVNPTILAFWIFTFISGIAMALAFSTYVPFLSQKGMNLTQIHRINAIFMIVSFFAEMPTGVVADRYGRHRCMSLSCYFLAIGGLTYYLSHSFWIFILAEITSAIGQTLVSGASNAWLVDSLIASKNEHLKNDALRFNQILRYLAIVIGCMIGGQIGAISIALPWLISAISILTLGAISHFFLKENYARLNRGSLRDRFKASWISGTNNKQLVYTTIYSSLLSFSVQSLNMQWALVYKLNYNFNPKQLGYTVGIFWVSIAIGALFSKAINKLFKNKALVLIYPHLLTAVAIILCARTDGLLLMTSYFMIHEFGRGVYETNKQIYLNDFIATKERATLLSFESMFVKLGAFLGLLISGVVVNCFTMKFTWFLSGSFLLTGAIVFIIATRQAIRIPIKN